MEPLTAMPLTSRNFSTLRDRIHDGKGIGPGVFFVRRGNGRVEDCKIWGNKTANVAVQDSGSQAVVNGCECANACACLETLFSFLF